MHPRIYTNRFDFRACRPRFCSDAAAIDLVTLLVFPLKALWLLFLGVISKYSSWTILVPIKFVIQPLLRCGRGQRHDTFLRFWKFKRSGTRMFGRYFEVFFADYTLRQTNLRCSHCLYLRAWSAATRKQSDERSDPSPAWSWKRPGLWLSGVSVTVIFVAYTVRQMILCSSPCSLVCRLCVQSHRSVQIVRCPAYTLCQTNLCSRPCICARRNRVPFSPCCCYCPLP